MTDATSRIKNLSIALEVLSRINTTGSLTNYLKVEILLKSEIALAEKEHQDRLTARSAATSTDDDDIPF